MKPHAEVTKFMSTIGRKGGLSKSPRKKAALKVNMGKARAARSTKAAARRAEKALGAASGRLD